MNEEERKSERTAEFICEFRLKVSKNMHIFNDDLVLVVS